MRAWKKFVKFYQPPNMLKKEIKKKLVQTNLVNHEFDVGDEVFIQTKNRLNCKSEIGPIQSKILFPL